MAETEAKVEIEFDRSQLGQVLGETEITVTEEVILRYAAAIGEKTPKYITPGPDMEAPPGILTVLETPPGRVNIRFPFARTSMHGSSALFVFQPLRAGEKLRVTTKLTDVYTKTGRSGPMGFVVYENEFFREDGTLVARIQDSHVSRP